MDNEHRLLIKRAFAKHGITYPGDHLPEPIDSLYGESEGATTHFFWIGSPPPPARLYAVKVPSKKHRKKFWTQLNDIRRSHPSEAAMLPIPSNEEGDHVAVFNDGHHIRTVLSRVCAGTTFDLAQPRKILTGIAGFSRVYFLNVGQEMVLVKFDRPDRLLAEWERVMHLRAMSDLPGQIILPLPANHPPDRILVYPVFHSSTATGDVVQLDEFLTRQLLHNMDNAVRCVDMLFAALAPLHGAQSYRYDANAWSDFNPELRADAPALRAIAETLVGTRVAAGDTWKLPNATCELKNPFARLEEFLRDDPGKLVKSRVHGDLQSTNVLVALEGDTPREVAIVDVEKFGDNEPLVNELTRVEADFWRSVFPVIARRQLSHLAAPARDRAVVRAFLAAHDALLRDVAGARALCDNAAADDQPARDLAAAAATFVRELRRRGWGLLRRDHETTGYYPKAYFLSLLFYYMKATLRPLVRDDPLKLELILCGASIATEVVDRMRRGLWPAGPPVPPDVRPPTPTGSPVPVGRTVRLGVFLNGSPDYARRAHASLVEHLGNSLKRLGHTMSAKQVTGSPDLNDRPENVRALGELLAVDGAPPDCIVGIGTEVSRVAFQELNGKIPFVYACVSDPDAAGLANATGVPYGITAGETVRILHDMFPGETLGYVGDPRRYAQDGHIRTSLERSNARAGGPRVELVDADQIADFTLPARCAASILFGRYYLCSNIHRFAERNPHKAFVGVSEENISRGAVATVGHDADDIGRAVSEKILLPFLTDLNRPIGRIGPVTLDHPRIRVHLGQLNRRNLVLSPEYLPRVTVIR
jgi:hypothetical protein